MSEKDIKNKITKSLKLMNESQLPSAWLILKELSNQEEYSERSDTKIVNEKIAIGIQQLNNAEGTDFREFLNVAQATYGKK